MDINTASILVEDEAKALTLCIDIFGFRKVNDINLSEFRWLMVSTDGSDKTEMLLKLNMYPAAKAYQAVIYTDGVPVTLFIEMIYAKSISS